MTLWNSETELVTAAQLSVAGLIDAVIPASGELFAVVDWESMQTTGAGFELSSQRAENYKYVGVLGDNEATTTTPQDIPRYGDFQYVFTVNAGQVIEIAQNNAEGETVTTTLRGASGDILLDSASQQAGTNYRYWYSETGGTFILHLDNSSSFYSSNITEATVTVTTATPKDLGAFEVGETLSESASELLEANRSLAEPASPAMSRTPMTPTISRLSWPPISPSTRSLRSAWSAWAPTRLRRLRGSFWTVPSIASLAA